LKLSALAERDEQVPRLSIRRAPVLATVGVLLLGWAAYTQLIPESPVANERDAQKPFRIDPDRPYEISYHSLGLPTAYESGITIKSGGQATARLRRDLGLAAADRKEKVASFTLPPDAVGRILKAIDTHRVMELHKSYRLRNTFDGLHGTLTIRQGERLKRVGCSNHFPPELTAFAAKLEAIVEPYRSKATWTTKKE
jgi:hypothetical protein